MKAIVFMADGLEECEALITVDILRRAGVDTVMASVTGTREIEGSHHIQIKTDILAEDVDSDSADLIVLPGGRTGVEKLSRSEIVAEICRAFAMAQAETASRTEITSQTRTVDLIETPNQTKTSVQTKTPDQAGNTNQTATGKYLGAICAAPSLLASLGLLKGRRATCHPDFEDRMPGAELTGASVTTDGNIITGRGLGATFDFALELVRILAGSEASEQIRKAIVYA